MGGPTLLGFLLKGQAPCPMCHACERPSFTDRKVARLTDRKNRFTSSPRSDSLELKQQVGQSAHSSSGQGWPPLTDVASFLTKVLTWRSDPKRGRHSMGFGMGVKDPRRSVVFPGQASKARSP